jgi:hypothetical protein
MEKRNKSKAKREAKDAAKQAKLLQGVKVLMPTQIGVTNLTSVLQPAFRVNNELPDALNLIAITLTRLRHHVGDATDMAEMCSRLMFGRRIAHNHFEDRVAENLHHAVQTIVLAYKDQYVEGQVAQVMSLDGEAGDEISEALHIIENMAGRMDTAVYLKELLTHENDFQTIDMDAHLQSWDDYLLKVGIKSVQYYKRASKRGSFCVYK